VTAVGGISKTDDCNNGHKGGTYGDLTKRGDVVQNAAHVLLVFLQQETAGSEEKD